VRTSRRPLAADCFSKSSELRWLAGLKRRVSVCSHRDRSYTPIPDPKTPDPLEDFQSSICHPAFGSRIAEPINRSIEEGMPSTGEPNVLLITLPPRFLARIESNAKSEWRPKMATNKFKLGQTVFLQATIFYRDAARGADEVTKQLPERNGQFEY
jgi:hypothetical protein